MGHLHRPGRLVAAVFGVRVPFFLWNCLMGFAHLLASHAPPRRMVQRRDEWSGERGYATTTVHIKLRRPLRRFDPLHSRARRPPREYGNSPLSSSRAQARLTSTRDGAAEFPKWLPGLLLEHRAACKRPFRQHGMDRFRRTHHVRTARSYPLDRNKAAL